MGTFCEVHKFEIRCPKCEETIKYWQSKDLEYRISDSCIDADKLRYALICDDEFYSYCDCCGFEITFILSEQRSLFVYDDNIGMRGIKIYGDIDYIEKFNKNGE
jgi:hypothetical protein